MIPAYLVDDPVIASVIVVCVSAAVLAVLAAGVHAILVGRWFRRKALPALVVAGGLGGAWIVGGPMSLSLAMLGTACLLVVWMVEMEG